MKLNEYEKTAAPVDYTPRPRASQDTAAIHRQRRPNDERRTTKDERHIPPWLVGVVGVLAVVGVIILAINQHSTPIKAPVATSAPVFTPPTTEALSTPTIPSFIARAYAAPDGVVLGPVDLDGEVVVAVGRAGAGWVQLERSDHTRVWFKRGDLPSNLSVADTLPDLSPPTPAPQTGRGLTMAVATPEPPAEEATPVSPAPTIAPVVVSEPLKVRTESDCNAEHGRCDPPCTAEHGRCSAGDE